MRVFHQGSPKAPRLQQLRERSSLRTERLRTGEFLFQASQADGVHAIAEVLCNLERVFDARPNLRVRRPFRDQSGWESRLDSSIMVNAELVKSVAHG